MSWKKMVPFIAAALLAAYLGARMANPESKGLALASPAAHRAGDDRIVVASTNAPDREGNRVIMVDTVKKQILVYRMIRNGALRLIAVRSYTVDLEWGLTPDARGVGFSYREAEKQAKAVRVLRARVGKKWAARGREIVLTCDSSNNEGRNRIVLVNPDLKTILIYRLNGNSIWLEVARPYENDQMLLYTNPNVAYTAEDVARLLREAEKKAMGTGGR